MSEAHLYSTSALTARRAQQISFDMNRYFPRIHMFRISITAPVLLVKAVLPVV
jgi:hypothetical protein